MSITHTRTCIALDGAQRLVAAVVRAAATRRVALAVAVCDTGGALVAFARVDGAEGPVGASALDKARAAAAMTATGQAFSGRMAAGAVPAEFGDRRRLAPGALPILFAGQVIGGIGVAGSDEEEDEEIAGLALNSLAD